MCADKDLRCDCGYRLRGRTEELQVAEVRRHASEVHGISFSAEEALAVLLRFELEAGATADVSELSHSDRDGRRRTIPSREE